MDFARFLIFEGLYKCLACCFRHNICSAWFLDIRISTCFGLKFYNNLIQTKLIFRSVLMTQYVIKTWLGIGPQKFGIILQPLW